MEKKEPKIKILYVPSLNVGVTTWRIENYANQLVEDNNDILVHVDYLADQNVAWDKVCFNCGETSDIIIRTLEGHFKYFDIIVFQKIQNEEGLILVEKLKKKHPKTIIIAEIDDAIGEVTPSNRHKFTDHHSKAAKHLVISDAVIASTPYLANSIKKIVGNDKPIYIAPNCLKLHKDLFNFDEKIELEKKDTINIAYVAGGGHDEDLRLFIKPILNILEKRNDVRLIIRYGDQKPDCVPDHPYIDFKSNVVEKNTDKWAVKNYLNSMYQLNADIGLAPLRDTEFNRCKSAIKYIEWAYLQTPVVASWVEPYKNVEGSLHLTENDPLQIQKTIENVIKYVGKQDYSFLRNQCLQLYNIKNESKKLLDWFYKLKGDKYE